MTLALPFNEEQRDCLQELTNVAIGAAAESLANLTKQFVNLPIPLIRFVDTSELMESFQQLEVSEPSSLVSQHCSVGDLACHALVVVSEASVLNLASCIEGEGFSAEMLDKNNNQLIESLFTTISDTCFESMSEMFEQPITREKLEVLGRHVAPETIDMHGVIDSDKTVAIEIYYHTEKNPFNCHLLLLFPENGVEKLIGSLNSLLH